MSHVTMLNLDFSEYIYALNNFYFRDKTLSKIAKNPLVKEAKRIIIFGKHSLALAIKQGLKEKNVFFDNAETAIGMIAMRNPQLIIFAEPAYPDSALASLVIKKAEEAGINIIFPFSPDPDIAFILESLPRSGTHYLYNNIVDMLQLSKANVNEYNWGMPCVEYRGVHFTVTNSKAPYAVFSHNSTPVSENRWSDKLKRIFLFSYPFDHFFSVCWILANQRNPFTPEIYEKYRIRVDSEEWQSYRTAIFHIKRWFGYIDKYFCLKYESFYREPEKIQQELSDYLCLPLPKPFTAFKPSHKRSYFHDRYSEKFDKEVFDELYTCFKPILDKYYPE